MVAIILFISPVTNKGNGMVCMENIFYFRFISVLHDYSLRPSDLFFFLRVRSCSILLTVFE